MRLWRLRFGRRQQTDVPQILAFIRALAVYEREPDAVTATEAGLLRDGFGPNPIYFCLMAEQDGHPAGFALYFFNYSTWKGCPGIYLEDLFVEPDFRGLGIGKALLQQVGRNRGGKRLPAAAMGGARLEYPGNRFLQGHGRGVPGRVAECAGKRRGT